MKKQSSRPFLAFYAAFLFVFAVFTGGVAQCSCTDCRCSDSLALVSLYNSTGGQNWTNKWILQQPMTTWFGIRLNTNGRVECLDLDGIDDARWSFNPGGNNLNGTLPDAIGNITQVKNIFIAFNPNLGGTIPATIGNLSKLEDIRLEGNNHTGNIPSEIGNLTSLKFLAFSSNRLLVGTIPNSFGQLTNLIQLFLFGNKLSGAIPASLSNLSKLEILDLRSNELSGNIPNFNLPQLVYLYLDRNNLEGTIPNFRLPNLRRLYLYNNKLSGQISDLDLPNLEEYNIHNNPNLGGTIPNSLGNLKKLAYINLTNCGLTQSIPSSLASLDSLIGIALGDNKLTGNIPNFRSKKLTQILLWQNSLSANIPNFDLPELWAFNIEGNKTINGNVPEFKRCPKLVFFNARGNMLTGNLPSYEWLKDSLQYLLLDDNKINATTIPAYNLPKLKSLSIGQNEINATLPSFNLPNATELWLFSNKIHGSIPNMVLSDTVDIRLDNNQLSGTIPRFSRVKYLAIAKNRFTFQSILTNTQNSSYTYAPQDSIYKDTTIKIVPNTPLSISLGIDQNVNNNSYQWYKNGNKFGLPTNSNTLIINPVTAANAGVYTCTVSNPNAPNLKLYSRRITLTADDGNTQQVQTGITPNGDGNNDALDFPNVNLESKPRNSIEIFNRWGQLVYRAAPYKRDWTGQDLQGRLLPTGDYFFVLRIEIADGETIVGSVYLSR